MKIKAELQKNEFSVAESCDVELVVRVSETLTVGDAVEVQFPNSWMVLTGPSFTRELQHQDPTGKHHINISTEASPARFDLGIEKRHLTHPDGIVRHGRHIVATLVKGNVPANTAIRFFYANTFAPELAETDLLWIRVKGQLPAEPVFLTTLAQPAEYIRIIAPSGVEPGNEFEVLIVTLDRFDNCSSSTYSDEVLDTTDGRIIQDELNFTGSIRVPLTLRDEGITRFRFRDTLSNVVRVGKGVKRPYWGDIHNHTRLSHDGYGTDPYGYARKVSGLEFAAITDHYQSLGQEGYDQALKWAQESYDPGQFVTLLADERNPKPWTGHHNLYVRDAEHFLAYASKLDNPKFADPDREGHLQVLLDPTVAMLIPHHTGLAWRKISLDEDLSEAVKWDACDDAGLRPVMEIYSHHGQSECWNPQHLLSYEFNRMRRSERRSNVSVSGPYYAQDYWMAGRRVGVIGSSDEHSAQPGRKHGGLTAVWSDELTREGIFDALLARHCYATTGERILMDFSVDAIQMGDTGRKKKGEVLSIHLEVWGTATLLRAEILRHRFGIDDGFETICSEYPSPESMDFSVVLEDKLISNCMYYARITQEPLTWPGMAWSSPVWIDIFNTSSAARRIE
jgi:hypothetical protein